MLRESGIAFERVNYTTAPLGERKLRELVAKLGIPARELLRTKEPVYRELNPRGRTLSDDEAIALMVAHPELMQRPIVERGARAVVARPVENIRTLLED
ncbi:MAG TPA: ArsC/Spx/MgsR family protein [Pyrinomonadaceae bacterium]